MPEAGLTGAAFVLPAPANPAARGGHRVYLKRMLLAEGAEGLLPEWAFFARCVVDTTELRPTASREALYEDQLLSRPARRSATSCAAGWSGSRRDPRRLGVPRIHHLGVKALALHDDEMLRLVEQLVADGDQRRPDDASRVPRAARRRPVQRDDRRVPPARGGRRGAGPAGGQRRLRVRHRDHRTAAPGGPRVARSGSNPGTYHRLRHRWTPRSRWPCARSWPPRSGRWTGSAARCCSARTTRRPARPLSGQPEATFHGAAGDPREGGRGVGRRARRARRHL